MIVIAGLGNPEREYKGTRHNTGFEVINKISFDHRIDINKAKHRGHIGEGFIENKKVLLLKPQTYMNLSGECIRDVLAYYKLTPAELIVIYDDCVLPVGDIRVRTHGSAGGHNGMKNILYQLETDEFIRVRVGIGEKPSSWVLADYVLSRFKKEEAEDMVKGITLAGDAIEMILKDGHEATMSKFNKKNRGAEE